VPNRIWLLFIINNSKLQHVDFHTYSTLTPRRIPLLTRRMKHCRRCGRLLIKPELSPQLTQFKRKHVALFVIVFFHLSLVMWFKKWYEVFLRLYIPNITVKQHRSLVPFKENVVFITFTNPQHCLMHLSLTPLSLPSSTAKVRCDDRILSTFPFSRHVYYNDNEQLILAFNTDHKHRGENIYWFFWLGRWRSPTLFATVFTSDIKKCYFRKFQVNGPYICTLSKTFFHEQLFNSVFVLNNKEKLNS
jgi:hypothetical protein